MIKYLFCLIHLVSLGVGAQSRVNNIEFYFFINSDNDLLTYHEGEVISQGELLYKSILKQKFSSNIGIHIYFDPNSQTSSPPWKKSRIVHINGEDYFNQDIIDHETNSNNDKWISRLFEENFFKESVKIFYFFGHGMGPLEVESYDYSHAGESFSYLQFGPYLRLQGIDLVIFDACEMAYFQVLKAYAPYVSYLMASQFSVPVEGLNVDHLDTLLGNLQGTTSNKKIMLTSLYQKLNEHTLISQKKLRQYAPFVLFKLKDFYKFEKIFKQSLSYFKEKMELEDKKHRSRIYRSLIFIGGRSIEGLDFKRMSHFLKKRYNYEVKNFDFLFHKNYGSLSFLLEPGY